MSPQHGRPSSRKTPRRARQSRANDAGVAPGAGTLAASTVSSSVATQPAAPSGSPTFPAANLGGGQLPPSALTASPQAESIVPGMAPTRAQRRTQAKQDKQRRGLKVAAIAAAVVLLVGAVFFLLVRNGGSKSPGGSAGRTQQTLALTVGPLHAVSVASALLGTDPSDNTGAIVLLPSRWLLDAAGAGTVFFGQTPTLGKNVPAESLTNSLGITVDGSWSLTPAGLAALVDDVGGVDVTVDTHVIVRKPNGTRDVLLSPGQQHLSGAEAAVYALYLGPREPEARRLARFDQVFVAVLSGLPTSTSEVAPLVEHLGATSLATVPDASLSGFLASLAKATQAQNTLSQTLPTHAVDTGGGTPSYLLDQTGAAEMIDGSFAGSKPSDTAAKQVRVLVQNGVGTPGLGESAYQKLHRAGFAFLPGGNANHFGYPKTIVLIPDGSSQWITQGQQVAKALGVPNTSVKINDQGLTVADIVVILGKDYHP